MIQGTEFIKNTFLWSNELSRENEENFAKKPRAYLSSSFEE